MNQISSSLPVVVAHGVASAVIEVDAHGRPVRVTKVDMEFPAPLGAAGWLKVSMLLEEAIGKALAQSNQLNEEMNDDE